MSFAKDVKPIVQRYCLKCHSGAAPAAGLSFDALLANAASFGAHRDVWDKIALNVGSGICLPRECRARRNSSEQPRFLGFNRRRPPSAG